MATSRHVALSTQNLPVVSLILREKCSHAEDKILVWAPNAGSQTSGIRPLAQQVGARHDKQGACAFVEAGLEFVIVHCDQGQKYSQTQMTTGTLDKAKEYRE